MSSDMFSTLDPSINTHSRRGVTFAAGLLAQVLLIGATVLLGVLYPEELPIAAKQYVMIWLPALRTPAEPVLKPPPKMVRVFAPKLRLPETPELTIPLEAKLVEPKIRPTVSSVSISIPQPPSPPRSVVRTSLPPKVQIVVSTGVFGGAAEPVTTKRPVNEVQTGGFGTPLGLAGRAQGDNPGNVPKLGAFGLPDGPGVGNGTGGRRGIQGVVASAGFGSGVAGAGYRPGVVATPALRVATGGFEEVSFVTQSPVKNLRVPLPSEFQTIEILSKPSPVYTEEARHLGIQGEVALSVVFQANGAIKVTGVVKSLGHGLDQAAEQAAAQIRFKPAYRAGQPTDLPATLRVEFRLADQSS
jgi:TonB family protein